MGEIQDDEEVEEEDDDILGSDVEIDLPLVVDEEEEEETAPTLNEIVCECKKCRNCRCRKAGQKCNPRCHEGSACGNK